MGQDWLMGPSSGTCAGKLVAPMFPLPNVFLFPGALMPLHIFEPRYKQMVEESLDGPGRIVMTAVLEEHHDELMGSPPVFPVGGLGEIGRHERMSDGRFNIVLMGIGRVQIHEIASDRLYRKVEAEVIVEQQPTQEECSRLRPELVRAVLARTKLKGLPNDMPLGMLADFLLMRLELPQAAMQDLYACTSIAERAFRSLAEHARRPPPPRRAN